MTTAMLVARFLIFLKEHDPRGLELSNLKLQKLLYYCQGKYLEMYRVPLFQEDIEAWKYGPVVPNVYFNFKHFGDLDIRDNDPDTFNPNNLTQRELSIIAYVWKDLGELRAGTLVDKTHNESPWLNTWFGNDTNVISLEEMRAFFIRNNTNNVPVTH